VKKIVELKVEDCIVKTLQVQDVYDGYISGLNDPEVNQYLAGVARVIQTDSSVSTFVLRSFEASHEMFFGIWKEGDEKHCGTIRLHGIDPYHRTAHIGVCLFDKRAWGRGLATKSIRTVTDWGLNRLGLRWLEAGVYEENSASSKLFERSGYEKKYTISGKYLLKGKPSNVIVYAACSEL